MVFWRMAAESLNLLHDDSSPAAGDVLGPVEMAQSHIVEAIKQAVSTLPLSPTLSSSDSQVAAPVTNWWVASTFRLV